jgi:arylsulfatase A-like enzyme
VGFDEHTRRYSSENPWDSIIGVGTDISEWFARNPDAGTESPFYMQIACGETHRDWERINGAYNEKGIWKAPYLIDDPEIDKEMAYMQGSANQLDRGLGELMDAFEKRGILQDTIFVITTDHGIDFPRAKGTLFDPGVEVGLFMRYDAGNWAKDMHNNMLVSHVDVYPTVLEACGIRIPEDTAGVSFLHALENPGGGRFIRDAVYLEKTYHDNYDPMRGLRTDRYKYVLNFDAQTLYDVRVVTNTRYHWFKFPFIKYSREELYDLQSDPAESNNLAENPEYENMRGKFKKQLADWMKKTNDPLLDGPMPSPYHKRISAEMKELADK